MPRKLSAENTNALEQDSITPRFLFTFDRDGLEYRYSNSGEVPGEISPDGENYRSADMRYSRSGDEASISISKNAADFAALEGIVLARVKVVMFYGNSGTGDVDFVGGVRKVSRGERYLVFQCGRSESKVIPSFKADESTGFNHLPLEGTKLATPGGDVILRGFE